LTPRDEFFEFEARLFWKRRALAALKKGSFRKKGFSMQLIKKARARLAIALRARQALAIGSVAAVGRREQH
jgi:hypothetical protein